MHFKPVKYSDISLEHQKLRYVTLRYKDWLHTACPQRKEIKYSKYHWKNTSKTFWACDWYTKRFVCSYNVLSTAEVIQLHGHVWTTLFQVKKLH